MKQVLSVLKAKKLIESGLDMSDASFFWIKRDTRLNDGNIVPGVYVLSLTKQIEASSDVSWEIIPTYTLSDLLDKLPETIESDNHPEFSCMNGNTYYLNIIKNPERREWMVSYNGYGYEGIEETIPYKIDDLGFREYEYFYSEDLLNAVYEMYLYLISNSYIFIEKTSNEDSCK